MNNQVLTIINSSETSIPEFMRRVEILGGIFKLLIGENRDAKGETYVSKVWRSVLRQDIGKRVALAATPDYEDDKRQHED
ncbi:hypothetical protein HanXRQr2_Chr15g0689061 [Helianthus annuus]|uniref:Uncharacterized protein n=1 Tax=Helianthus annuus TaxID=4232 RepID=A0A9K3E1F4_HELAN|nr:hypothetical protein HanXRQr2_Chr15g0689061 [Helianthus annuus]